MESNTNSQTLDQNLNEIYYNYNKSIIEYYKTFQRIIDLQMHNTSNRINTSMEIEQNMMYYMNLNIQSFHTLTKQMIETIREIHIVQQQSNRASSGGTSTSWVPPSTTTARPIIRPQTPVMFPVRPETSYTFPVTNSTRNQPRATYQFDLTNAFTRAYREDPPQNRGLTRRQITEFTQDYIWTQVETDEAADASGNICPISLERFRVGNQITRIRACNHQFKRSFLMRWLERDRRCPVCRHDVTVLPEEPEEDRTEDQELEEEEPERTPEQNETQNEDNTTEEESSRFGSNTEDLIERFLTNELNQIINDDVADILRQMAGNVESRTSTTEIETPLGTIEISREVIPIDIQYSVRTNTQEEES